MTEHYTMQEAVELARECGFTDDEIYPKYTQALINTAVTRKLAEKELEVVKLRSQLFGALMEAAASHEDTAISVKYDADVRKAADCAIEWTRAKAKALSTPSSTKALDEYVEGKVEELESKIAVSLADATTAMLEFKNKWIDATTKLTAAEERVKELEKDAKRYRKWKQSFFAGNIITPDGYDLLDILLESDRGDKWDKTIDAAVERSE